MIDNFLGAYGFLSNFYVCKVEYNGLIYTSSEAAFQAQKTEDLKERKKFCTLDPSAAKRLGRKIKLRSDWDTIKDRIMYEVVLAKFSQNEDLKTKLLETGFDTNLIEGNTWHDNYWGNCTCSKCQSIKGKNHLGTILMSVRNNFKNI